MFRYLKGSEVEKCPECHETLITERAQPDLMSPFNLVPFICAKCNKYYFFNTDVRLASIGSAALIAIYIVLEQLFSFLTLGTIAAGFAALLCVHAVPLARYVILGRSPLSPKKSSSRLDAIVNYAGVLTTYTCVIALAGVLISATVGSIIAPVGQLMLVVAVLGLLIGVFAEAEAQDHNFVVSLFFTIGTGALIASAGISKIEDTFAAVIVGVFICAGSYLVFTLVRLARS